MDYKKEALSKHASWMGKIEIVSRAPLKTKDDLSVAYTPGVAEPCLAIKDNPELSYLYTRKNNTVAVVSDGSAVLGLGNIGALAGLPVMEGKCILFKEFGNIDAVPIVLSTQDEEEIIKAVKAIAPSFGGINLEDISAPKCFNIEKRLIEELDIPVFHDDQHGTAVVLLAALINALKLVKKKFADITVAISGPGAAGNAIAKILIEAGVGDIIMCDRLGILYRGREKMDVAKTELANKTNKENKTGTLKDALIGADVFVGVSAPDILTADDIKTMAKNAIVFALANPVPEIMPEEALNGGASVVGTGRSDFPNQINNVLAFPAIFRGALDVRASAISNGMKVAAAYALASLVSKNALSHDYIIPSPFDPRIRKTVSEAVAKKAKEEKLARI